MQNRIAEFTISACLDNLAILCLHSIRNVPLILMKTIILLRTGHNNCFEIKSISARVCGENPPPFELYRTEQAKIEGVDARDVEGLGTLDLEEWAGDNADRGTLLKELASMSGSSLSARALNGLLSFVAGTAYVSGVDYGYDTW